MRNVDDLKSVADIRTATSAHLRSTPRHKGTPYQEVLSFGMERLRLEREVELIARRQERVQQRLGEAMRTIESRIRQIQGRDPLDPPAPEAKPREDPEPWRTKSMGY